MDEFKWLTVSKVKRESRKTYKKYLGHDFAPLKKALRLQSLF